MKKLFWLFILMILTVPFWQVRALPINDNYLLIAKACDEYFLGSINDPNSFMFLLQEIFNIFKYAAPICVLVFSTIDYVKSVANQNKEDVAKVTSKTAKRLIFAGVLYFLPTLINFLFNLLNWTGTCNIK